MRSARATALIVGGTLLLGACTAGPGPTTDELEQWTSWLDETLDGVEERDDTLGSLGGLPASELMDVGSGGELSMSIPGEVAVTGLELYCTGAAQMTFAYTVAVSQETSSTLEGSCDGDPTYVDLEDTGVGAAHVTVSARETGDRGAFAVILIGGVILTQAAD